MSLVPPVTRPRSNSGSSDLQAVVESERQEVLTDVKEQNQQQFEEVEAIHQHLQETADNALDMFKRELPQSISTATTTTNSTSTIPEKLDFHQSAVGVLGSKGSSEQSVDESHPTSGFEKNTTIINTTRKATHDPEDKDFQIESLSISLIQTRQAYNDLINKLYQSPLGSAAVGADSRGVGSVSVSSSLLTAPSTGEKSLHSFLADLPVKKSWLMLRHGNGTTAAPNYVKKFFTLTFDGLYYCDNEASERGQKIDLAHYWLIEHTEERLNKQNYAAGHSELASSTVTSPKSPLAGHSLFRMEDGAYIIRLVPILSKSDRPEQIIEPAESQIIELTGVTEEDVADGTHLASWVDAINLRISLLSLENHPDHLSILAHGGRDVLTFLCTVNAKTLLIENKYVNVPQVFSYFKETLFHRRDWSLVLRNVGMNDAGVKVVSEILMLNHQIYHLDLSHNSITDVGAAYLASVFEVNENLQSINLDYNRLSVDGLNDLAMGMARHAISSVSLRGNRITDAALAHFVTVLKKGASDLRSFTLLDFSFNELTDQSASPIGMLIASFVLSALRLAHNKLTDTGLNTIINTIAANNNHSLHSLTLLDLASNQLTSSSINSLVTLLNHIGDKAALDISGNTGMTLSSLQPLINSGIDVSIDQLRLRKTSLTPETSNWMAAGNSDKPGLTKRMSIVKETAKGRVELIDPLHPCSQKQLGRNLNEVSEEDKRNVIDASGTTVAATTTPKSLDEHPPITALLNRLTDRKKSSTTSSPTTSEPVAPEWIDDKKECLDVPMTAAATELLVDGGKTADPRSVNTITPSSTSTSNPGVSIDTHSADARSLESEAVDAVEAAKAREAARSLHSAHSDIPSQPESIFAEHMTEAGLRKSTPQQIHAQQADATLKGKYPQANLDLV